jgi:TPR repeat protein
VSEAQNNLGMMYMNGENVPKNAVLAYKLFTLAANSGYSRAALNQREVALAMSAKEIVEGLRLAREFKPQKTPTHEEDSASFRP